MLNHSSFFVVAESAEGVGRGSINLIRDGSTYKYRGMGKRERRKRRGKGQTESQEDVVTGNNSTSAKES